MSYNIAPSGKNVNNKNKNCYLEQLNKIEYKAGHQLYNLDALNMIGSWWCHPLHEEVTQVHSEDSKTPLF